MKNTMSKSVSQAKQLLPEPPLPDYHIHTVFCRHADGPMPSYVETARMRLLPEISFSCHAPDPDGYDPPNRMKFAEFGEYKRQVAALQSENRQPNILFGIEADYHESCVAFLRRWLPEQPFDLVLGSVHYVGDWAFDSPVTRGKWETVDVAGIWRAYFKLVGEMADTRLFDVFAHADLPKKFGFRPSDREIKEMVQPALDRIAEAGMALEINTSGLRKPIREIYPSALILGLARERDIPICFGSDAHVPGEVGQDFTAALALARDAGYTHSRWFKGRSHRDAPLPEIKGHT